MLVDKELRYLITDEKMITEYIDLETQLQPNGFDLSIKEVMGFSDAFEPRIDFTNKNRLISLALPWLPTSGEYHLDPGTYLFRANEFFKMPATISGWGMPRSTLSRCGITVNSAIIDAGYSGHLVFVVTLPQKAIFSKNARFIQVIFFKLRGIPTNLYDGVYKESIDLNRRLK